MAELAARCYHCGRKIVVLEPGGHGMALLTCPRCKRRNLVDVATGVATR